jgi:hypothetical protein
MSPTESFQHNNLQLLHRCEWQFVTAGTIGVSLVLIKLIVTLHVRISDPTLVPIDMLSILFW